MKTHAINVHSIDATAIDIRRVGVPRSAHPKRQAKKHAMVEMIVRACIEGTWEGTLNDVPAGTFPYEFVPVALEESPVGGATGGTTPPGKEQYPKGPLQSWYTWEFTSQAAAAGILFHMTGCELIEHH
jgi:hypothetical protein